MKVSEAKNRLNKIDVKVIVLKQGEKRAVNLKVGGSATVCDFLVEDDTDQIWLTLWNEDTDKIKVGDIIEIKNGYTNSFKGDVKLLKGKYGELIVNE